MPTLVQNPNGSITVSVTFELTEQYVGNEKYHLRCGQRSGLY